MWSTLLTSVQSNIDVIHERYKKLIEQKLYDGLSMHIKSEKDFYKIMNELYLMNHDNKMKTENNYYQEIQRLNKDHLSVIKLIKNKVTECIDKLLDDMKMEQHQLIINLNHIGLQNGLSNNDITLNTRNTIVIKEEKCEVMTNNTSSTSMTTIIKEEESEYLDNENNNNDNESNDNVEVSDFICFHCGEVYLYKNDFEFHNVDKHEDDAPYHCNKCDKSFGDYRNRRIHIEAVHDKKKNYYCDECEKGFYYKTNFREHLRTHTGEQPFQCNECDKKFNRKQDLQTHIDGVHRNKRQYHCTDCDRKFNRKQDLQRHINEIHRKLKPHKCGYCDTTYTNP